MFIILNIVSYARKTLTNIHKILCKNIAAEKVWHIPDMIYITKKEPSHQKTKVNPKCDDSFYSCGLQENVFTDK